MVCIWHLWLSEMYYISCRVDQLTSAALDRKWRLWNSDVTCTRTWGKELKPSFPLFVTCGMLFILCFYFLKVLLFKNNATNFLEGDKRKEKAVLLSSYCLFTCVYIYNIWYLYNVLTFDTEILWHYTKNWSIQIKLGTFKGKVQNVCQ